MELTKENLQEWKAELNRIAQPHFGENFANSLSDEQWLVDEIGNSTDDVLHENLTADH